MSRLAEHLFQNENTHKQSNERLMSSGMIPSDLMMNLTCECGDDECTETIEATIDEWDKHHAGGLVFMIAPNHYFPRFEDLIGKTDRFWVVKKKEERLEDTRKTSRSDVG